jgi:hypothetical protein
MDHMSAQIEAWLRQARTGGFANTPSDELIEHIASCAQCRGQLLALLAELMGPVAPRDLPCAAVADDMAGFVDYERAHGLAAAARTFPTVWWNTLVCPSCDELYRDLQELAALPVEPWVASPERIALPLPVLLSIVIEVSMGAVRRLIGLERKLGPAWGAQQSEVVIAEKQQETLGAIQIFLRRMPNEGYALVVQTNPPISGVAVLVLAGTSFRAPLDTQGCALFEYLTDDLLRADPTSKLTLTIEQRSTLGNRE